MSKNIRGDVAHDYSAACVMIEVENKKLKTVALADSREGQAGRIAHAIIESLKDIANENRVPVSESEFPSDHGGRLRLTGEDGDGFNAFGPGLITD